MTDLLIKRNTVNYDYGYSSYEEYDNFNYLDNAVISDDLEHIAMFAIVELDEGANLLLDLSVTDTRDNPGEIYHKEGNRIKVEFNTRIQPEELGDYVAELQGELFIFSIIIGDDSFVVVINTVTNEVYQFIIPNRIIYLVGMNNKIYYMLYNRRGKLYSSNLDGTDFDIYRNITAITGRNDTIQMKDLRRVSISHVYDDKIILQGKPNDSQLYLFFNSEGEIIDRDAGHDTLIYGEYVAEIYNPDILEIRNTETDVVTRFKVEEKIIAFDPEKFKHNRFETILWLRDSSGSLNKYVYRGSALRAKSSRFQYKY